MTTTRFIFTQGLVAKLAFPLLTVLLLVGCNNADPYGGQNISGNILSPKTVNPLDGDAKALTQVALFAGKPVDGLYYICADSHGTRAYTTQMSTTSDSSSVVTSVPVALCGNEAASMGFYLGKRETANNTKNSVLLGKVVLPFFTPVGSDSKHRYCINQDACGDQYGGISETKFLFDFSLADTQISPASVDVSGSFDASGNCVAGKEKACKVVYVMALLQALDENKGTGAEISIPLAANEYLADPNNAAAIGFAGLNLNYTSYAAFKTAWDAFVSHVCDNGSVCNGLENFSGTLLPELEGDVAASKARLQAGNYSLNYTDLLSGYGGYYNSPILNGWVVNDPSFSTNFMVYADGYMAGFGAAAMLKSVCPNKPSGAATSQQITDYLICVVLSVKASNYVLATGMQPVTLDQSGQIQNLKLVSLEAPTTGTGFDIDLVGRVLNGFLYDGRQPQSTPGELTDFGLDYPANTASSGNFVLADSDKGSIWGSFFDTILPASTDGSIGVDTSGNPTPFPVRLNKSGGVQNTPLDQSVLSMLSGQYYRVQLQRFCTEGEACTAVIPVDEVGTDAADNYPDSICPMDEICGSANPAFKPSKEAPMTIRQGNVTDAVNLRFGVWDGHSDHLDITLLDDSCQPVTDSNFNAMRVGTVIATPAPNTSITPNIGDTADISLFFVPPDTASVSKMPFLGVSLSGRIDLAGTWPIYRLGDDNFAAQVRAHWQGAGYQATSFFKSKNVSTVTAYHALSLDDKQMAFALTSGAATGQLLQSSGSCQP